MENTYYTPDIGEFKIGFEFEVNEEKWQRMTVDEYMQLRALKSQINKGHIRVKHLNKEDIESLGFSYMGIEEKTILGEPVEMFHSDNLMLGFYPQSNRVSTYTKDPSKCEIYCKTNQDTRRSGLIRINNKSELKKLMEQVRYK